MRIKKAADGSTWSSESMAELYRRRADFKPDSMRSLEIGWAEDATDYTWRVAWGLHERGQLKLMPAVQHLLNVSAKRWEEWKVTREEPVRWPRKPSSVVEVVNRATPSLPPGLDAPTPELVDIDVDDAEVARKLEAAREAARGQTVKERA